MVRIILHAVTLALTSDIQLSTAVINTSHQQQLSTAGIMCWPLLVAGLGVCCLHVMLFVNLHYK